MKSLTSILLLGGVLAGCRDNPAAPDTGPEFSVLAFAARLKEWSQSQPAPYVIAFRGGPDTGSMGFEFNLVSNVRYDDFHFLGTWHDSLFIDTAAAASHSDPSAEWRMRHLMDSAALPLSEQQMIALLDEVGLKLRRMEYDDMSYYLAERLRDWGNAQSPPRVIRCDWYMLCYEGANTGGTNYAYIRYESFQNLRFLTRHLDPAAVSAIANSVLPMTSEARLQELLSPLGTITFHTTRHGPE